jgi:transposase
VLWIARTGSPWRDLPPAFGNWNTVFKRYRDWVKADVFKRLFAACSDDPDMEYAMIDATIVKVHRHGQGAKGGTQSQAIGRSKGGMTTKIWRSPMPWAISCVSRSCPVTASTPLASRR